MMATLMHRSRSVGNLNEALAMPECFLENGMMTMKLLCWATPGMTACGHVGSKRSFGIAGGG